MARRSTLRILPAAFIGIASTISSRSGNFCRAIPDAVRCAEMSASDQRPPLLPARQDAHLIMLAPLESRTPMTEHWRT